MHSIRYGYAPESFNDVWNLNANRDHDYQLRNNNEFVLPAPRIEFVKKQPIYTFQMSGIPLEIQDFSEMRLLFGLN